MRNLWHHFQRVQAYDSCSVEPSRYPFKSKGQEGPGISQRWSDSTTGIVLVYYNRYRVHYRFHCIARRSLSNDSLG